jgi:glycosyltransferase involved in cell wall biosynthesis
MYRSKNPLISICLPNLNNRDYLEERIRTIYEQTYSNWELVIVDNYSDDGAWEYFQTLKDPRVSIQQAPIAGMYANWNNCIRLAEGDCIYIATSDDTLEPQCLEKMVAMLNIHKECDIAHCNLIVLDGDGNEIKRFYEEKCKVAHYFEDRIHQLHIRHAPHDGFLHYCGGTVYISITQLLIRKTLFDKIGLFRTDMGSAADFEWEMRASLLCNTIHIPEYLASWRIHQNQATSFSDVESFESRLKHLEMTRIAWNTLKERSLLDSVDISKQQWERVYVMDAISLGLASVVNPLQKLIRCLYFASRFPLTFSGYLRMRIAGKRFDSLAYIRKQFHQAGLDAKIEMIES